MKCFGVVVHSTEVVPVVPFDDLPVSILICIHDKMHGKHSFLSKQHVVCFNVLGDCAPVNFFLTTDDVDESPMEVHALF